MGEQGSTWTQQMWMYDLFINQANGGGIFCIRFEVRWGYEIKIEIALLNAAVEPKRTAEHYIM